ncbi:MAG TPA: GntR family transcriptional regulator [Geminicoccus sp.]|jgi:DNA-binding GntR family transcriptional regulator|uniref:GntR family transcriptional regulator n=1 Tax=Geminicoccus sp. TaxID=2024832 RepID=UPI002E2FAE18|nr:GntR family transcriptional regulator [Geminicoccus sp.]HEX2528126.1 GntR family transcriptional regulator [Geminicoccus sp.]
MRDEAEDGRSAPKLREQAYDRFTHHLLGKDLKPGQFVSQRELVALTGMPLGAIRELIPRLEAEGLIRTVPQRGMQIAHLDLNLIRDTYQLRLFLERPATRSFVHTASDAALKTLHDRHASILQRAENGELSPALQAEAQATDWGMHDQIIDALGNEIISKTYRVNSIKIRLIRDAAVRINDLVVPVMREHLGIIERMLARDEAGSEEAMAAHIERARLRALNMG